MVTRKAILIGSSGGYRNLNFLRGVDVDLENYFAFLTSKAGGQWRKDEIVILQEPNSKTVTEVISKSKTDYTFITFSGHGFINTYDQSDYVCLKDEDLSIAKLVSPSDKQTIIIDACREIFTHIPEDLQKSFVTESKLEAHEKDTRDLFDAEIQYLPKGILLIFSTQSCESAGEDDFKGGHFTYSFIKSGRIWWDSSNNKGVLRINTALDKAKEIMKATFITKQTPAMAGQVRRLTFPPFACSK